MELDRRSFLKSTMIATAAAALGGAAAGGGEATHEGLALPVLDDPPDIPGVRWDKAPCRFCGVGCHMMVGVKDGQVVAITGDQRAEVNRGLLCVKGYHAGAALYGEDRLTTPLLRRDGQLVPIDWIEAINIVAQRIARSNGRFALYGSGQWTIPEGYAAQKFVKGGLGSNQIDANARLYAASAITGFVSTYGTDETAACFEDLDAANVVINWNNNLAEVHPVLLSRLLDRRAHGQKPLMIDIATRRTRTTAHSEHHVQFRPQTDLAIINCIAQQLIARGGHDRAFVERHCRFRAESDPRSLLGEPITFEQYERFIAEYTPAHVAELSGVSRAQLEMLGRLFADGDRRIVSLWCTGVNGHTQGTAMNNLIHAVHLLSGHWGRPGDGPLALTAQPSTCGTVREVGTLAHALPGGRVVSRDSDRRDCERAWNLPEGRIAAEPGYHALAMWEQFNTPNGAGGMIDTLWVQASNPGQTLPNNRKLFKRKAELEDKFLIVSEAYPTATTELADLVLPSAMWIEKHGIYGNSERRTQQWFKMVDPPGDARPDAWQIIAVAHRLLELGHDGMTDADGRFIFRATDEAGDDAPIWRWEHFYDVNVDEQLYEEYRPLTAHRHQDVAPYQELVRHRGLRWPVVESAPGRWQETRRRFVEGEDVNVERGKGIQFYHSVTGDDRALIWFRPHMAAPEVPDESYPFWLVTGRVLEHWHSGSMTRRISQLRGAMPRAYVEMNPEQAARMRIGNGQEVVLETQRGSLRLPVWLDGRSVPPEGMLFVPVFDENADVNALTLDAHDPYSKQPGHNHCAARLRLASNSEPHS